MFSSRRVSAVTLIIIGAVMGIGIDRYWLMPVDSGGSVPERETALEHACKHADPDYVCPLHVRDSLEKLRHLPIVLDS